jgi:hypothetical protein
MLNSLGLSFIMARFFDLRVGGSSLLFVLIIIVTKDYV